MTREVRQRDVALLCVRGNEARGSGPGGCLDLEWTSCYASAVGSGETRVHVVRKRDLRSGERPGWDDPKGFAAFAPEKRALLLDNPASRSEDDPVQIIGTVGDRVVGRLDLIAGEIVVDGEVAPALWTSALAVEAGARNKLIGVSMMMQMHRLAPTCMVCGVSQMAIPFFQKLKWVDLQMPRFVLLRKSRSVVERFVGKGAAPRLLGQIADVGLAAHGELVALVLRRRTRDLTLRRVAAMPPELDEQLARLPGRAAGRRTSAHFAWLLQARFHADPDTRRDLHLVESAGRVVGWVLTKVDRYALASSMQLPDLRLGSVMDWGSFDLKVISESDLVRLGVTTFGAHAIDGVEVCTADAALGLELRRLGLMPSGSLRFMFRATKASPLADPAYAQASAWRLRPADGDKYFF